MKDIKWKDAPFWADRLMTFLFVDYWCSVDRYREVGLNIIGSDLFKVGEVTIGDLTLIEMRPEQELDNKTIPSDVIEHDNNNKYSRKIKTIVVDGIDHDIYVDVYDVLTAFKTDNPAVDHAVKKELAPGVRGVKSRIQDFMEARDSLNRAIEIEKAKGGE